MASVQTLFIAPLAFVTVLSGCSSDGGGSGAGGNGGSAAGTSGNGGATGGTSGRGGSGGGSGTEPDSEWPGFHVSGRFLYDRCDNKVLLRGVNEMVIWSASKDGVPVFAEVAKTGANVVRIVWNKTGTAAQLDTVVSNALAAKLIPIVENHDATGDITKVAAAVDYWVKDDIVQSLSKYQDRLLLNIANEPGDGNVDNDDFVSVYTEAIARLRQAGYTVPLIIDGTAWGSNYLVLQSRGPKLVQADALHNILLSVHTYWDDPDGSLIRSRMQDAETNNLPLIIGEFADTRVGDCTAASFNVKALMETTVQHQIGWLAWSWGAVKNSDCPGKLDMSSDGTFDGLQGWGLEVAVTDPNSIKNTSVRPPYIEDGACK